MWSLNSSPTVQPSSDIISTNPQTPVLLNWCERRTLFAHRLETMCYLVHTQLSDITLVGFLPRRCSRAKLSSPFLFVVLYHQILKLVETLLRFTLNCLFVVIVLLCCLFGLCLVVFVYTRPFCMG